jgi:hypothetical protein
MVVGRSRQLMTVVVINKRVCHEIGRRLSTALMLESFFVTPRAAPGAGTCVSLCAGIGLIVAYVRACGAAEPQYADRGAI